MPTSPLTRPCGRTPRENPLVREIKPDPTRREQEKLAETEPIDATIQRISSRIVYQNPWMQLREDVIQRPDGSQGMYSYVDKPDFALIIPVERGGFHLVTSTVTPSPTARGSSPKYPPR